MNAHYLSKGKKNVKGSNLDTKFLAELRIKKDMGQLVENRCIHYQEVASICGKKEVQKKPHHYKGSYEQ